MEKRDIKLDNLKGILIILVVFGHFILSGKYNLSWARINFLIYAIHMPLFMIISGYFSKKFRLHSILQLGILFLFLNTSYLLYDYFNTGIFDFFKILYSSWYLGLIFLYRLLLTNSKITKYLNKYKKICFIFSFFLSIISGFIPSSNVFILRIMMFLPFFLFGYYLNIEKIKLSGNKIIYFILLLVFLGFIVYISFDNCQIEFLMGYNYYNLNEMIYRLVIFLFDFCIFILIYYIISNKELFLINRFGKNTFSIYFFHRIIVLLLVKNAFLNNLVWYFIFSMLLCFILSFEIFNSLLKKLADECIYLFRKGYFFFIGCFLVGIILCLLNNGEKDINAINQEKYNEAFSIGFVGDLILLEDAVQDSIVNGEYNFDYMFEYTKDYFKETDLMIGVFEGPSDDSKDYSYGNYSDNKELRLNFPTNFIKAIKNAGIDLVTTANNHLLDRGIDAFNNTIDNLEKYSLDYVGSYKNKEDKLKRKIIEVENLRIGILAYTYGINYYQNNDYPDITSYLANPLDDNFFKVKQMVKDDFTYLRQENVDLIVVLPHYGTQFSTKEDNYQKTWNKIFVDYGANIILGDHPHIVEPMYFIKDTLVVNSPGNYVNSYVDYNGDISMMTKIYIDRDTKKILASSIIPLVGLKKDKSYFAIPTFDALNNNEIKESLTSEMQDRATYATSFVLQNAIDTKIEEQEREYLYIKGKGYLKQNPFSLKINDTDRESIYYQLINKHTNICMIGDSITEGNKNGYYPWYYWITKLFNNKNFINISTGGYTTNDLLEMSSELIENTDCDLSIINIGTNDIRFKMVNEEDYLSNMEKIVQLINSEDIIIMAPWETTRNDYALKEKYDEKKLLYSKYNKALERFADSSSITYINPNEYIKKALEYNGEEIYLLDGVHPNNKLGVKLYSMSLFR